MDKNTIIPIFFACDDNFVKFTNVALTSMIANASKDYQYYVHILNTGISEENRKKTLRLANENFHIFFEDVTDRLKKVEERLPLRDYYSLTTYYRLFMAEMFPQYKKALYIDSDTIILGDISELYQYELGENYVGAIPDQVVIQSDTFGEYVEKVLDMEPNFYFNAGVLLMNCDKFREEDILNQFIELLNTYTFVVAQDQDYLNIICKNHVQWLDPKWNAEVFGKFVCEEDDICLLHYNLVSKPWHYKECRKGEYFWEYAKQTEDYEAILNELESYTEEEKKRDRVSSDNLLQMAISEIQNENNYRNLLRRNSGQSKERLAILDKIAEYERQGRFDEDVEEDPPAMELKPEDIDYMRRNIKSKFQQKYADKIGRWFLNMLIRKKQMIIKDIVGIENFKNLSSGAVVTCNHFNPFDSFAMQVAYDKSKHRKRKFYRVIREGNYTNFPGFYGFLMRNCNTLPLSSNFGTMRKFIQAVDNLLKKGHFVLIYPEQSMWWNYRKPKPLKKGAYTFAAKNMVPVLPCFITMKDSTILDQDGFYVQEYTIHISEPIYPDPEKTRGENVAYMKKKNYEIWKEIYEETYQIPLVYTCDEEKMKQYLA